MINLDFSFAVALYIAIVVAANFCAWVFMKRQKDKDLSLDPRFIWFCSICSYTYINTKEESISVCPRCASYNSRS